MKRVIFVLLLLLNGELSAGEVGNLHNFTSGTPAKASEVNENFSAIGTAVNDNAGDIIQISNEVDAVESILNSHANTINQLFGTTIASVGTFKSESQSDMDPSSIWFSEIVAASCFADELLVGGSCSCVSDNFDSSTTNFGQIRYCSIAGNSYIGGCAASLSDADLAKAGPPITVTTICLNVTQVNGNVFKSASVEERKPDPTAQAEIDRLKELQAVHESVNISKSSEK